VNAPLSAAAVMRLPDDATPFERAAATLDLLSNGPWAKIATWLWAELSPADQAELHRRAAARGVVLRNPQGGTVRT
jgi:hypothetical protein